jgi:hypothetical protein
MGGVEMTSSIPVPKATLESEDLRGLAPPEEERDLLESLFDAFDSALTELDEPIDAVAGHATSR